MKQRILYKLTSIIISLIFCSAVFMPLLIGIYEEDRGVSENEKRKLANYPKFPDSVEDIKQYPKLFDQYYSDHFGLRDWFSGLYKRLKYSLGDSPSEGVIIGKNGWLFLGSIKKGYNKIHDTIAKTRSLQLFSPSELKIFASYIQNRNNTLKARGIDYFFVIAPDKRSVYFDQLPDYMSNVNAISATDWLVEYLKKNSDVSLIDLRKSLIEEKENNQLYYKTDTHWNYAGSNIAQYAIMKEIDKKTSGKVYAQLLALYDGELFSDGDLSKMMGVNIVKKYNPIPKFNNYCVPEVQFLDDLEGGGYKTKCDSKRLNAIIIKDSFFNTLQHFFSRKFKQIIYLNNINTISIDDYIQTDKPDIVVEQWVERNLHYILKNHTVSENKKIFDLSEKLIFSLHFSQLYLNEHLKKEKSKEGWMQLSVLNSDPNIIFPELALKPENKYMIHIQMESSVNSILEVFYSDITRKIPRFSAKNYIHHTIKKGNNDLYIILDHQNIDKYLRIDPIAAKGRIIIKSLDIKQI